MGNIYGSLGIANSLQLIDSTNQDVLGESSVTSSTMLYNTFTINDNGDMVPFETMANKLAMIFQETQSELRDAWVRLAQM